MIQEADLGFAASFSNQLKTNSNSCAGAGANANSKADIMQFVGSDTLAELVWSPTTGLTTKFAESKPCFLWEVGPSDHMRFYNSENTQNEELIASPLKIEPVMQCGPDPLVEQANIQMGAIKMEKDGCFSDPFLENAQVESSHGSMESCRSANFLTERKRKCSLEQQLIFGSKRIKNQADGSSFMNWISNTLKGLKNHNIYDPRVGVCDETRRLEGKHFGFHNVFQSLFSPETIKQLEHKSIGDSSSKETVLAQKCSHGSLSYLEIKDKKTDSYVKHVSFYERVTKEAPKDMFDTIRKLRLSRTDILKWMNSRSSVAHNLDGFFLRLRVAKWEEGAGGSRYYVACITGSQGETPWKNLKQSIRVKVGNFECLVKSQYVSNCDFLEDELIGWWEKTSKNGGIPAVKDLKSKLAERRILGM